MQKRGLLPNGTTLAGDRYRIQRHIASGGFGNTYYAVDTTFDEPVVIKELFIKGICGRQDDTTEVTVTLRENKSTFDAHRDKFRKEARRLRRLSNVHIVGVHDLFDENGTSYYVMDFIDGESLASLIKRRGVMSEAEVRGLLPGMLDALKAVHAHNIWHLDIKPGNILVNKAGVPMLIDFGASKHVHSNDANSVSMSSGMAYTMGYAPTEQMEQDPNKFGPWTDLYSLGATLYKLLTNSQIPSPSSIAESGRDALPFPLGISPQMQDLILWLMQPMRTKRPQSVDEVEAWIADKLGDTGDTAVVIPEDDIIPASAIEVLPDEEPFETPYVAPIAQPVANENLHNLQNKEENPAGVALEKKPEVTVLKEDPEKKSGGKKGLYLFIAIFVVTIVVIYLKREEISSLLLELWMHFDLPDWILDIIYLV
ncbi:MAG: serine/threonine protein kinase [Muribaculaceae bacterium]|nr:serine/threonine protein kinase [Muribaculaceae bacterium]